MQFNVSMNSLPRRNLMLKSPTIGHEVPTFAAFPSDMPAVGKNIGGATELTGNGRVPCDTPDAAGRVELGPAATSCGSVKSLWSKE